MIEIEELSDRFIKKDGSNRFGSVLKIARILDIKPRGRHLTEIESEVTNALSGINIGEINLESGTIKKLTKALKNAFK